MGTVSFGDFIFSHLLLLPGIKTDSRQIREVEILEKRNKCKCSQTKIEEPAAVYLLFLSQNTFQRCC